MSRVTFDNLRLESLGVGEFIKGEVGQLRVFRTDNSELENWSFIQQPLIESLLCARHGAGIGSTAVNITKILVPIKASIQ